jgi:hypothetical protein
MVKHWLFGLIASSLIGSASHANTSIELGRSGKWNVDYDEDSCHLSGVFGAGEKLIAVRFTRYQPGDSFDLELFGPPLFRSEPYSDLKVDFGPVENPHSVRTMNGSAGKVPFSNLGSQRLDDLTSDTDMKAAAPLTSEFEASVSTLTLRPLGGKTYRLQLGSMRATMAAMRQCTDDLVHRWGFDQAALNTARKLATPLSSPENWLAPHDFPVVLLFGGNNGIVHFRLDVNEQGMVEGCHIQARTGAPDFATATCELLTKRAKFSPALNQKGQAFRSYYVGSVRWMNRG